MSVVIKVSKEGKDVKTSSVNDTILDSKYPLQKIALSGTGEITIVDSGTGKTAVAHNLGYKPQVMVFLERAPSQKLRYVSNDRTVALGEKSYGGLEIGVNNITVSVTDIIGGGGGVYHFNYYIYYDRA